MPPSPKMGVNDYLTSMLVTRLDLAGRRNRLLWGIVVLVSVALLATTVCLCNHFMGKRDADKVVAYTSPQLAALQKDVTAVKAIMQLQAPPTTPEAAAVRFVSEVSFLALEENAGKRYMLFTYLDASPDTWPESGTQTFFSIGLMPQENIYMMHVDISGEVSAVTLAVAKEMQFDGCVFTLSSSTALLPDGPAVQTSMLFRGSDMSGGFYVNVPAGAVDRGDHIVAYPASAGEKFVAMKSSLDVSNRGSVPDRARPAMDFNMSSAHASIANFGASIFGTHFLLCDGTSYASAQNTGSADLLATHFIGMLE